MTLVVLVLQVATVQAEELEGSVALIAARGSVVEVISLMDVRRLYLGLKSVDSQSVKNPVINLQSKTLYDEFMKNIMHMTEGSYKRKIVKRMFRQGRGEIVEAATLVELNKHLLENRGDISFVELSAIENMENIEVIQILW